MPMQGCNTSASHHVIRAYNKGLNALVTAARIFRHRANSCMRGASPSLQGKRDTSVEVNAQSLHQVHDARACK